MGIVYEIPSIRKINQKNRSKSSYNILRPFLHRGILAVLLQISWNPNFKKIHEN